MELIQSSITQKTNISNQIKCNEEINSKIKQKGRKNGKNEEEKKQKLEEELEKNEVEIVETTVETLIEAVAIHTINQKDVTRERILLIDEEQQMRE